jgi:tryptophan-rich sensory protein
MDFFMFTGTVLIFVIISICFYFLPTIIAFRRNRHNKWAIFLLNFFLGWSLIGWVVSLVWAVSTSEPPVVIVQGQQPPRT